MAIGGLSRRQGPVGGGKLDEVAAGIFDLKNFFAGAQTEARLFGVFTLDQVLARITGATENDMPRIVTDTTDGRLKATMTWRPRPQSYPPTGSKFVVKESSVVELLTTIEANGGTPKSDVTARIEQFELHLVPPTASSSSISSGSGSPRWPVASPTSMSSCARSSSSECSRSSSASAS